MPHELRQVEREAIFARYLQYSKAREWERTRCFEITLAAVPPLFVKQESDIQAEASTQHFFYTLSIRDESAPRVAKVIDAFRENGVDFLVMEKIEARTLKECGLSDDQITEHAASAVCWLFDQASKVPPTAFGRISSYPAPIVHRFFKDHDAPRVFTDSDDLAHVRADLSSEVCRADAMPDSELRLLTDSLVEHAFLPTPNRTWSHH